MGVMGLCPLGKTLWDRDRCSFHLDAHGCTQNLGGTESPGGDGCVLCGASVVPSTCNRYGGCNRGVHVLHSMPYYHFIMQHIRTMLFFLDW